MYAQNRKEKFHINAPAIKEHNYLSFLPPNYKPAAEMEEI